MTIGTDESDIAKRLEFDIREFADKHGPSGPAWNISTMLELARATLARARTASSTREGL